MLQRPPGVQPDPSLGLLVREEQTVLGGGTQTLDLSQLLAECFARLHHRGLKRKYFIQR